MRDTPEDAAAGRSVETERVAGVAVPTTCRDQVDDETLAGAVAVLDDHSVHDYTVSPVGGLKIRVGVHRPDAVVEDLRSALERVSGRVTTHGTSDGFHRILVDITTPAEDGSESGEPARRE
jgi:hypothetical protein